jgi:hypothetical protein
MVRFSKIDVTKALAKLDLSEKVMREESIKLAGEIAELGELEMKANILTSGTQFSDAARAAGINSGPGRYRTGAMYNAVQSRVQAGASTVSAAFGWIRNFQEYFLYQELGFRNLFIASYIGSGQLRVVGGQPVIRRNPYGGYKRTPGMFALRDAAAEVQRQTPKFVARYVKNISRRVNKK